MGFWHTGYMEFHEPYDSGIYSEVRLEPVKFTCQHCSSEFKEADLLRRHRFESHPARRPTLFVRGFEVGGAPLQITSRLGSSDVQLDQCEKAKINGSELAIDLVADRLASLGFETVRLELSNSGATSTFELRFAVANESDLSGVEASFGEVAQRRRLEMRDIESFIDRAGAFRTAAGYVDGICHYFYGVLAKERHSSSSLAHDQYVEKYRAASDALKDYRRPLAATVMALIAFHFNHYPEIAALGVGGRVELASERLRSSLHGDGRRDVSTAAGGTEPLLEQLLTEAHTERILRWTILPGPGLLLELPELEAFLRSDVTGYDAAKLRVLLAESYLADGRIVEATRHANELVHNLVFGEWACKVVSHGRVQEDRND